MSWNRGGGVSGSLVVLTATSLNSQRSQGRLLCASSYQSDIVKVCVIYFILVVLRLVRYSWFDEAYMKKSQMLNRIVILLLSIHLCWHTAWHKCNMLYLIKKISCILFGCLFAKLVKCFALCYIPLPRQRICMVVLHGQSVFIFRPVWSIISLG